MLERSGLGKSQNSKERQVSHRHALFFFIRKEGFSGKGVPRVTGAGILKIQNGGHRSLL